MSQRDTKGRFLQGHKGGPGNPYARRVAELRCALFATVKDSDIAEVISGLFAAAKAGDVAAAKIFLSYTVGNPTQSFQLEADISAMQKVDYDNLFESLPKENLIHLLRETHKNKLIHENNP